MTNCVNCGAPIDPTVKSCTWCGTSYTASSMNFFKNQKTRKGAIYPFFIGAGVFFMFYLYGFAFDSFSETMLVNLSPLWFCSIMFGIYGFIGEKAVRFVTDGKAKNFREGYSLWQRQTSPLVLVFGLFLFFPLNFIRRLSALWAAFVGALFWMILLMLFIHGIFPSL
ncbi:MAG: hypothetical protein A2275_10795 [Bacteroidetes bacterium RIFOXYA12_FULL_35_11]|nr:MAG: hypothetical protein A2X01_01775 [Bacteroidetes bacterium GWF2_35_48]OFY75219.1 MAG: hypothetical protein A2275_10795 [Bacteroidetes bacterium RIFOXYA12_FULL_35_11]OFY97003.1 MAG: hypothetical protein A2491_17185 [Bacteroidetes bacterium RIFOXYC12_FULL_35_7]